MYEGFALLYDDLNLAADYDTLAGQLVHRLREWGIEGGILADLGCGTGEVALRLCAAGYDVIGIDASQGMLSVFRDKIAQGPAGQDILLVCQPLQELDLYGTIRAAVSTFDTFNHLAPGEVHEALRRASLFMEPGGVLLLDANTPYKHRDVLGDTEFLFEDEHFKCRWQNSYRPDIPATRVHIQAEEGGDVLFTEEFLEYEYDLPFWQEAFAAAGFSLRKVEDGERFAPLQADSQRFLFTAQKNQ